MVVREKQGERTGVTVQNIHRIRLVGSGVLHAQRICAHCVKQLFDLTASRRNGIDTAFEAERRNLETKGGRNDRDNEQCVQGFPDCGNQAETAGTFTTSNPWMP